MLLHDRDMAFRANPKRHDFRRNIYLQNQSSSYILVNMELQLKEFQAAVSIHSLLGDTPKPTKECARVLGLKMNFAKVVVLGLSRRGLIRAVRGNGKKAGLTKSSSVEQVHEAYGFPLTTKIEPIKPSKTQCDVCGEMDFITNEERICTPCLEITENPNKQVRIARCGHETAQRYFACEKCQPTLEEDSIEFCFNRDSRAKS